MWSKQFICNINNTNSLKKIIIDSYIYNIIIEIINNIDELRLKRHLILSKDSEESTSINNLPIYSPFKKTKIYNKK